MSDSKKMIKMQDLSGMQTALEALLTQAWERGYKYGLLEMEQKTQVRVLIGGEQIYPDTATQVGGSVSAVKTGMTNWRTTYNSWGNDGEARQGDGTAFPGGASKEYYGYLFLEIIHSLWTNTTLYCQIILFSKK